MSVLHTRSRTRNTQCTVRIIPPLIPRIYTVRTAVLRAWQIAFQAPRRPGFVPLVVLVKSPVFVGVDCEGEGSFRVYRHEDLKEDEDGGDW